MRLRSRGDGNSMLCFRFFVDVVEEVGGGERVFTLAGSRKVVSLGYWMIFLRYKKL
jgi:hypothetical protein